MMQAFSVLDSIVAVLAFIAGLFFYKWFSEKKLGEVGQRAQTMLADAERDIEARRKTAELEVKEAALKTRVAFEEETRRRERDIEQIEQRILGKEEQHARKLEEIERRLGEYTAKDKSLLARERALAEQEHHLAHALEEQTRKLEAIAGLTADEAKRQLLAQMEEEARREATLLQMKLEEQAREVAHEKAKEVLATTIQRLAPDYTVETAVSVIDLPSSSRALTSRESRSSPCTR